MPNGSYQEFGGELFIIDETIEGEGTISAASIMDEYVFDFDVECESMKAVRLGATKRGRVVTGDEIEEE